MQYTCQRCGTVFDAPATARRKYCGRACMAQAHAANQRGRAPDWTYSAECRARGSATRRANPNLGHKTAFVCDNCGETFYAYPCQRPRPLKFCDRACGLEYQRSKTPAFGQADTEPTKIKPAEPGTTVYLVTKDDGTKDLEQR